MQIEWNPSAEMNCKDILVPQPQIEQILKDRLEIGQVIQVNKARGRWECVAALADGRILVIEFAYRGTGVVRVQAVEVNVSRTGELGE